MTKTHRNFLSVLIVTLALALAAVAVSGGRTSVSLRSVLETWMDVVRDVDRFGLRLTRATVAEEQELGNHFLEAIRPSLLSVPVQARYVSEVGNAIVAHARRKDITYRFHISDWPVANAIALPGGHVIVTRKLLELMKSEAELAAILGHEIAHIDLRHCVERYQYELKLRRILPRELAALGRVAHELVVLGYSEIQEREADKYGMLLAALARYHPKQALAVYDRFSAMAPDSRAPSERRRFILQELGESVVGLLKDYFATHPPWDDRMREGVATLSRNELEWTRQKFYVGKENHKNHYSRAMMPLDNEWKPFSDQPFKDEYFGSLALSDYKAMATHLPSGMAAIVSMEASPETAIRKAIIACQVYASPCRVTGLGEMEIDAATTEDLTRQISDYLFSICARGKRVEACSRLIGEKRVDGSRLADTHLHRAGYRLRDMQGTEALDDIKYAGNLGTTNTALLHSHALKLCTIAAGELKVSACTILVDDKPSLQDSRVTALLERGKALRELNEIAKAAEDFSSAIALAAFLAQRSGAGAVCQ